MTDIATANHIGSIVSGRLCTAGWLIGPSTPKHREDGMFVIAPDENVNVLVNFGNDVRNRQVAECLTADVRGWTEVSGLTCVGPLDGGGFLVRFAYSPKA